MRNPERSAIIPTTEIGFQVSRKIKVNIPSLNVRSGPGLNMTLAGTVKMGEVYALTREASGCGEIGFIAGANWIIQLRHRKSE